MSRTPDLPSRLRALAEERHATYAERAGAADVEVYPLDRLPGDAARVLACSTFVSDAIARDPSLLAGLVESGDLTGGGSGGGGSKDASERNPVTGRVEAALEGVENEAGLLAGLRRIRRREMVRIAWRDIGGLATLDETLADTSVLADAAVAGSLARLDTWHAERFGTPPGQDGQPAGLIVFALGKLGAGELNFSSDIDLIFAYSGSGDAETEGGRRSLANHEYFLRLGRRLVKSLSDTTADGWVYRVDMRLRPFGDSGPLVISADALEDYYLVHGRDWERYALIRMRPIAGDIEAGNALLERLRPFVYRRYLDFSTLESLRDMKRMIVDEVNRRGYHDNVKLGAGGIRELEFTGQAFQMVRGGRVADLRDRRILVVLERIAEHEMLPAFAVAELITAYRFLRDTENRIQQMADRQAHLLPEDEATREVLAAGMRFERWEDFLTELTRHRERVHTQFSQVFGAPSEESEVTVDNLGPIWSGTMDDTAAALALENEGFDDGAGAVDAVRRFGESYSIRMIDPRGRDRLARLMPDLLRAAATQSRAEATLGRVLNVIETIARRSVYLALLAERPLALGQLVRLCAASPWIARHVGRHPVLLDELLDPRTLYAPLDRAGLLRELDSRLANVAPGDAEQEMEVLRQHRHANVLRVAAADVSEAISLMVVSDHLTEIAETALARALEIARRDIVARYGEPLVEVDGERRVAPFAIVGYGKLGGYELGYSSDLDLVFVHGSEGANAMTDGRRSIDNTVFFARLAQRVIHVLSTHTAEGVLYEVDPRLRPSGQKGVLVNSIPALDSYLRTEAWTWEHQAIVRARPVAGDPDLGRRFVDLRRALLLVPRDPDRLRTDVRDMRMRMRRELGTGRGEGFDLKQDPGGIADIEFMVQYLVLRSASELGEHVAHTDNVRLLDGIGKVGLMGRRDVRALTDIYRRYRARAHRQALQEEEGPIGGEEFADERAEVLRIWEAIVGDPGQEEG